MCVEVGCLCPYGEGPFVYGMALQPCLTLLSPSHHPPKLSTALHSQREEASPSTNGNTCFPACFSTAGYSHPKSEKGSDVLPGANHGLWNLIRPTSQQEKVCRMLFRNGQTLQGMSSIINQACHRPLPPPATPPPSLLTPPPPPPSLLLSAVRGNPLSLD